jgi:hypothetical protein
MIKIGSKIPVDCFPPKIIARVGTTIIETPGTPVLDIPMSIAQNTISTQSITDKEKGRINPVIKYCKKVNSTKV